jgi:hypothetical protein
VVDCFFLRATTGICNIDGGACASLVVGSRCEVLYPTGGGLAEFLADFTSTTNPKQQKKEDKDLKMDLAV